MTATDPITLQIRRCSNISAADAVRHFVGSFIADETLGLLYTPRKCHTVRLKGPQPYLCQKDDAQTMVEAPLGWEEVFELRIFHADAELRWLHEAAGLGTAVMLTESTNVSLPTGWCEIDRKDRQFTVRDKQDNHYLLWGKLDTERNAEESITPETNWSDLDEPRVGLLTVPVRGLLSNHTHVILKTREYFAEADDDGNVVVFEERLLGFAGKQFEQIV